MHRGDTGAASELVVAADLLRKGYQVFRAVSPASSCDLLVMKDDKFLRVEVKTGSTHRGVENFPPRRGRGGVLAGWNKRYDALAVVHPSGISYYGAIGGAVIPLPPSRYITQTCTCGRKYDTYRKMPLPMCPKCRVWARKI